MTTQGKKLYNQSLTVFFYTSRGLFGLLLPTILSLLMIAMSYGCSTEKLQPSQEERTFHLLYLEKSGDSLDVSDRAENARTIDLVDADQLLFVHSRDTESVLTYRLEEAGVISSAVHFQTFNTENYLGTKDQKARGHGIFVRPDDLGRMWLFNRTEVWQFDLPKAGDIEEVHFSAHKDLSSIVARGHDIDFDLEGNRFYVDDREDENIYQFDLATPWSIDSMELTYTLDISSRHESVRGLEFSPDGQFMYLLDTSLREVQQFQLAEPWEIRGAELIHTLNLEIENPRGFTWNADGSSAYVMDATSCVIYQFNISAVED